ncbi:uncharacterized protein LOC130039717 [Sorex fumeus]|uniref:uncharacterized protein LOC130039717 n=1 Tax=Sorex fumeus TaxID=62283 RepID=UPI0024ADD68E|nr:uncharacterized protein LOC130039717 [Sorex fumeus]
MNFHKPGPSRAMPRLLGLLGRLWLLPPLLLLFIATQAPGLPSAGNSSNNCCKQFRYGEVVCLKKHFKDQNFPEMCHPCRSCGSNTEIRPCTNISDTVCAGDGGSGTEVGAAGSDAVTRISGRTGPTWDAALTDSPEQTRNTNTTPTEGSESGGWGSHLYLHIPFPLSFILVLLANLAIVNLVLDFQSWEHAYLFSQSQPSHSEPGAGFRIGTEWTPSALVSLEAFSGPGKPTRSPPETPRTLRRALPWIPRR